MPNFKKFVALSLGSVCLLSSCNYTVNADVAKKFIETNYGDNVPTKQIDYISYSLKVTYSNTETAKTKARIIAKAKAEDYLDVAFNENNWNINIEKISNSCSAYQSYYALGFKKVTSQTIDSVETETKKYNDSKKTYTISGNELAIYFKINKYPSDDKDKEQLRIVSNHGQYRYDKLTITRRYSDIDIVNVTEIATYYYK